MLRLSLATCPRFDIFYTAQKGDDLHKEKFSNLEVDEFCAVFWIQKWTTEELPLIIISYNSFSLVFL